jgi:hypothetical protein
VGASSLRAICQPTTDAGSQRAQTGRPRTRSQVIPLGVRSGPVSDPVANTSPPGAVLCDDRAKCVDPVVGSLAWRTNFHGVKPVMILVWMPPFGSVLWPLQSPWPRSPLRFAPLTRRDSAFGRLVGKLNYRSESIVTLPSPESGLIFKGMTRRGKSFD